MTLYERYTTGDTSYKTIYGQTRCAQTFTVGVSGANENHDITSVKVKIYRYGYPGTITAMIRLVDGAGKPTGGDLSTGTINGNGINPNSPGAFYEINMSSYTLLADTQYALILKADDGSSSRYIRWRRDNTPSYPGGAQVISSDGGSSWTVYTDRDLMFEIHGTETEPPPEGNRFMKPNKYW